MLSGSHLSDVELERIMKLIVEEKLIIKLLRCFERMNEPDNEYRHSEATLGINHRQLRSFLN
jgi:hypothetical protein